MKLRENGLKTAFLITTIHCIVGNYIGMSNLNFPVLEVIFLPYTFIAGMSQYTGWGILSLVLEILSFILMTLIFYPIAMLFERKNKVFKQWLNKEFT